MTDNTAELGYKLFIWYGIECNFDLNSS